MAETWTILAVLSWTTGRFAEAGIESARLDAEVLLAHTLGAARIDLYTRFDKPLEEDELGRYRELVRRRLRGEPVAYLVGEQEFWSLPIMVDERVLVPRRDTETLVEVGIALARAGGARRIADVATGSGAVAVALAKELPEAQIVATDVSPGALEVAEKNVRRLGLEGRIELRGGDLVAPLSGVFDLIVANPPYVPTGDLARLAAEVRREPKMALDGGEDGLTVVGRLVTEVGPFLAPGAALAIEHGYDQAEGVARRFRTAGFADVKTHKDLAGRDRVTSGRRA